VDNADVDAFPRAPADMADAALPVMLSELLDEELDISPP
jgi:hypothetical protein